MNFQSIISLVLSILGKREELVSIVTDAVALFKRAKETLPDLTAQLGKLTEGTSTAPASSTYSVSWLQESLNKLVGANLKVDGAYGDSTREAVKQFQTAHGLTADGWAGIQTQAAIVSALG